MKRLILFLFYCFCFLLRGEALPLPWMKLDTNGLFQIGGMSGSLLVQTQGYRRSASERAINCRLLKHPGTPELDTSIYLDEFTAFKEWPPLRVEKRLTVHGSDSANWRYSIDFPGEREMARIALSLWLPESDFREKILNLDARKLTLPGKYEKVHLFQGKVASLTIPFPAATLRITGKLNLIVQDQRIWNEKGYAVILLFTPASGAVSKTNLEFDLVWTPIRLSADQMRNSKLIFTPIDLKGSFNNTTSDRVPEDGGKGWTDQGPGNDLSCFRFTGIHRFKEIPFKTASGPENVVTVGGSNWKQFPREVEIPVGDRKADGIYFLHTSAWTTPRVGTYRVNYVDGSTAEIPVRNFKEIFNWTNNGASDVAVSGWSGKNAAHDAFLTIFSWVNPHPGKAIHSIIMRADAQSPQVFFSLLGLTLSGQYPYLLNEYSERPALIDDSGWTEVSKIDEKAAESSALDASPWVPAPAGKFGFVHVRGEGFVFDSGRKARFLGINFADRDCFPEKEVIRFHARRLRRLGFNAVRFHKYDGLRENKTGNSLYLHNPDSGEFDPEMLDRMLFAMAELKKNGIYWCLDLLCSRKVKRSDYPEFAGESFYTYGIFMPRLIELQKQFITKFLTAKNPYTGETLAGDPALALLIVQNEDSLLYQPNRNQIKNPLALAELKRQFNAWLLHRYPTRKSLAVAWKNSLGPCEDPERGTVELPMNPAGHDFSAERHRDMRLFYCDTQRDYYRTIRDHLRSLGVKTPLAGSSHWTDDLLDLRANAELDYVDRHAYWAHPTVADSWAFDRILFNPQSLLKGVPNGLTESLASRRIAGKPFAVTEWNDASTNEFRAEAQLVFPACASMHDWQIFQFSYSPHGTTGKFNRPMVYSFGIAEDPVQLSLMPVAAVMFHRGDCAGSGGRYFEKVPDSRLKDPGFTLDREEIKLAARRGKAGIAFEGIPVPEETRGAAVLSWNSRSGYCRIDAARTQGFVGFPGTEPVVCGDVALHLTGDFAAVALTSLDNLPLKQSKRMLLSAVARGWNKGMKFNSLRNRITKLGSLPRVMQPVTGKVVFPNASAGLKVYELDYSGRRKGNVPLRVVGHTVSFDLTGAPHYEVITR